MPQRNHKKTSESDRAAVIRLLKLGEPSRVIRQRVGISQASFYRIRKSFLDQKAAEIKKKEGK